MSFFDSECPARFACTYPDGARISRGSAEGVRRRGTLVRTPMLSPDLHHPLAAPGVSGGAGASVRLLAGLLHEAVGLAYSVLMTPLRAIAADGSVKSHYPVGADRALSCRADRIHLGRSIGVFPVLSCPKGLLRLETLEGRSAAASALEGRS